MFLHHIQPPSKQAEKKKINNRNLANVGVKYVHVNHRDSGREYITVGTYEILQTL